MTEEEALPQTGVASPTVAQVEIGLPKHRRGLRRRGLLSSPDGVGRRVSVQSDEQSGAAVLTTADVQPSGAGPEPSARGTSANRWLRLPVMLTLVGVAVIVLGAVFAAGVWPFVRAQDQTVEYVAADGTTITVRVKVIGGDLRACPWKRGR